MDDLGLVRNPLHTRPPVQPDAGRSDFLLGCKGVAYGVQLAAVFRRRACGQSVTGIAKLDFFAFTAQVALW